MIVRQRPKAGGWRGIGRLSTVPRIAPQIAWLAAFCGLLLVGTLGYVTTVFCALVAYAFFGLGELGNELEEPFGEWLNALPLTATARTVKISLLEALQDDNLPAMVVPVDAVLREAAARPGKKESPR